MRKIIWLLPCLLMLTASCIWKSGRTEYEDMEELAAERRFREVVERGTLRVAVSSGQTRFAVLHEDGTYSGPEIEMVRKAAKAANFNLYFFDARPESIPGYIRAGRADIGIGGLHAEQIRGQMLLPVMEYTGKDGSFAFAVWNRGVKLKKLLENQFANQK